MIKNKYLTGWQLCWGCGEVWFGSWVMTASHNRCGDANHIKDARCVLKTVPESRWFGQRGVHLPSRDGRLRFGKPVVNSDVDDLDGLVNRAWSHLHQNAHTCFKRKSWTHGFLPTMFALYNVWYSVKVTRKKCGGTASQWLWHKQHLSLKGH